MVVGGALIWGAKIALAKFRPAASTAERGGILSHGATIRVDGNHGRIQIVGQS